MIVVELPFTGNRTVQKLFAPIIPSRTANPACPMLYHLCPAFTVKHPYSPFYHNFKKGWRITSAADGNSINSSPSDNSGTGTRLVRAIQIFLDKIEMRIRDLRKNLPVKLLFFLVGFYSATAFATVIGQTGDWDILSAALAVAVVEGIGALMYKDSLPLIGKLKSLIIMFNYWKAGLSLGLFLDSFKY
ncbi:OLC1v1002193C1 [Oldenlandia corymbosa var. corymbosa]|uniref:OLC1v1002193C1 n=1 Tax=Oldenlandia corymbosa var. corymbosa TaxID=529605 RepID=A0AAV1D9Z2_OLDCO|nr:OLC1v1002193C1 [Oldenlandia corymbosa var. corymbosa]